MDESSSTTKRDRSPTESDNAVPKKRPHIEPSRQGQDRHFETASGKTLPFSATIGGPYKVLPRIERAIVRTELDSFFGRTYDVISSLVYATTNVPAAPIISRANFITAGQYFLNGRVHAVHAAVTGQRSAGFTRLPHNGAIPKCISDVLMQYGQIRPFNSLVEIIPLPWTSERDPAATIGTMANHQILNAFAHFVSVAQSRGFISLESVGKDVGGTFAYVMSSRDVANPANAADINNDETVVYSAFDTMSTSDAIYCSLMANGFMQLDAFDTIIASSGPINSMLLTRTEFIRSA